MGVDFAGDQNDRKSIPGYCIERKRAVFLCTSEKQAAVPLSTSEAEYHAIVAAAEEIMCIKRRVEEYGWNSKNVVSLSSDNQPDVQWVTENRCPSTRAKCIDVQVHLLRNLVGEKMIAVEYCST